jgi:selenocysteine lyase/cysteine desulfurase
MITMVPTLPFRNHSSLFRELEKSVETALETYSNVHRGSGHYSLITTKLYEYSRKIIIDYLGLDKNDYEVIFCTEYGADILRRQILTQNYFLLVSNDFGLPLGLSVMVIKKCDLPEGIPFQTGGSVVKIVSPDSVIWADSPQKYEAGTPSIINAITFASALSILKKYGKINFSPDMDSSYSAADILYKDDLSGLSGLKLLEELKEELIGNEIFVPTEIGLKPFVNMDNAASTPTFSPVWDAVKMAWRIHEENYPEIINEVKNIVSSFLSADRGKYEFFFTSNATEALNIAARFTGDEFPKDSGLVILNSLLEHNSNELPWRFIPGASVIRLGIDDEGFINLREMENLLHQYNKECKFGNKRIRLVAASGLSNVLGTYNNIQAISSITHKYNARILVDGAQLTAHRSVNLDRWDIDYYTFSGHKVYAPFGSGVLIMKKEFIPYDNKMYYVIKSSGENNITGITALGKALILLKRIGMDVIEERERTFVYRLLKGLQENKNIKVYGIKDPDSKKFALKSGVITFNMKRIPHNLASKELAEKGGVGVRNGCFCAHLLVKHLLDVNPLRAFAANIGMVTLPRLTKIFLPGLIRVSLGIENDFRDVDHLIKVLNNISSSQVSFINKVLAFTRNGTPFLPRTHNGNQIEIFIKNHIKKVYPFYKFS